jgi:hypothetical protein
MIGDNKMKNTFGRALNGVAEPHRRESHIGRISTVGSGGKSITVTNMNNSELRNLVPIMPYGISSSPLVGLMTFVLVANNSGRDGMVGVYDPSKPYCNPGDSMLYSSGGATVHCNGKKVLLNKIDVLEEINKLNTKIGDLEKEINTLNNKIKDLENRIDTIEDTNNTETVE